MNVYFTLSFDDKVMSTDLKNNDANMSMVYLSIENVRYKFQSRRGSIALVAVGKTKTRKEIGSIEFIKPIKDNIIRLSPVVIRGKVVYFSFCKVCADNKGGNELIVEIAQGEISIN